MHMEKTPLLVGAEDLGEALHLLSALAYNRRVLGTNTSGGTRTDYRSLTHSLRTFFEQYEETTLWFRITIGASIPAFTMHAHVGHRAPPGELDGCMPLTSREYWMYPRRDRTYNEG